ncbi:MAG TPA: hypothetical protein VKW78_04760 [Terriglobales bacterium]|nr:hypothetical protein [Terriglobales bacterium]
MRIPDEVPVSRPEFFPNRPVGAFPMHGSGAAGNAGLLFRDLLDRCKAHARETIGAYNRGLLRPNQIYAVGVPVEEYAKRTMGPAV